MRFWAKLLITRFLLQQDFSQFSQFWLKSYNEGKSPLYRALRMDLKKPKVHIFEELWDPLKKDLASLSSCMSCLCELLITHLNLKILKPEFLEGYRGMHLLKRALIWRWSLGVPTHLTFASNLKEDEAKRGIAKFLLWTNLSILKKFEDCGVLFTLMEYMANHNTNPHFEVPWSLKK